MTKQITLSKKDFNFLALSAFRYAIGRQSYAPSLITNIVLENKKYLTDTTLKNMCREASGAILTNQAGASADVKTWQKLIHECLE